MNPYEILGVEPTATDAEIKSAYRKFASELHPDKNPDPEAEKKFKEISNAYTMLKTPEKRAAYDRGPMHQHQQNSGFNADHMFNHFADMFRKQQTTKSFNIPLQLSIEDIFSGKRITTVINIDNEDIDLDFAVPAGVPEGSRFTVKSIKSKTGFDVVINVTAVSIQEKERQRHGNDILILESISVFDAMLGTEIEVEPIKGQKLKLKIPAGTQPDTRLLMRGAGLPVFNQAIRGNVIAIIKIQIPKDLTADQIDILEQFR